MIELNNISFRTGKFHLHGVSFRIETGEYCVLMGRTGCGKTSILEVICGLRSAGAGTVDILGRDVTRVKPSDRGIGYVPQDLALFPFLTVRDHLAFALRIRRYPAKAQEKRVNELAELLGIGHLLRRRPEGLSGGESQKVALGRALAAHPDVLCLDEPLSALDDASRDEMYSLLELISGSTGVTALHVTHSRTEAERLADRILRFEDGRII